MGVKERIAITEKKGQVEEIKQKISKAKSIVLVDYRGLNVAQVSELRNNLRKENVEYKVLKNTLVRRALNDLGYKDFDADLNGTTAFAFSYNDEVSAARVLKEASAKYKKMKFKSGLLSNAYIDAKGVEALASLPPREVLIAQLLGTMNAPITGFVTVLAGILKQPLYALNSIIEKQQG